ncbi:MAG: hypothetical protein ABIO40_07560 [Devosia sp.]
MNRLSTLALVAALTITPVLAQTDTSVSAGVDVSAATSAAVSAGDNSAMAGADASTSASVSGSLTFDDLIGDIGNDDWTADVNAVTSATATTTITIVEVSSLEGSASASATALADASAANSDRLTALHTAVAANAAIQAKLTASGHDTDDVVAVKADASGSLWVYVDEAE